MSWAVVTTSLVAAVTLVTAAPSQAAAPVAVPAAASLFTCPPAATALTFSDALNKTTFGGGPVSELSAFAPDLRTLGFISISDEVPRLFFIRNPVNPQVTGIVDLKRADLTPYDGDTFDGEGVAVLPDGRILVSSELEPSLHIFGRNGVEQAMLPVPARFRVTPAGEGRSNGTLEGLTISPSGQYVYSSMEAPLSGDAPATGESLIRRMLVYKAAGGTYSLLKQIGYQADPGHRISDIASYADGRLVVLEIQFIPGTGVDAKLFAVTNANTATDVSGITNLSTAPAGTLVTKQLVANLPACPTLGATSPGPQINPLMDNYEGLAAIAPLGHGPAVIHLISDDNSSAAQITRLLTLSANLP